MKPDYYAKKLGAERLRRVYQLANPRVVQYLQAEIAHVTGFLKPDCRILELGCGYGRILGALSSRVKEAWGMDNALPSLELAHIEYPGLWLSQMEAARLGFGNDTFDLVFGAQNFISACKTPPRELLSEALRITRPGGLVLLSSYAAEFWPHRLAWFEAQADEGLLGPIDQQATGDGVIVCKDGFSATTFSPEQFEQMGRFFGLSPDVYTVDNSSVFCCMRTSES